MMVQDITDIYTQQYSLLSIGSTSGESTPLGVGTFGGEYSGDDVLVKFYPDSNFTGDIKLILIVSVYIPPLILSIKHQISYMEIL